MIVHTCTLSGVKGSPPHNPFKDFKFCPDTMRMVTSLLAQSCGSINPLPIIPCLVKLNEWLTKDKTNAWTGKELEATIFPPNSSCLDIKAMSTFKTKHTL